MKFNWLLPGFLGIVGSLVISLSAEAATLQTWRFNASENRLVFTTDEGVQPRAQLIADPTRLVIDLPGVTLGRSTLKQEVGGAIREVRIGQFDAQTARIVIELTPGYTLDPAGILIRGTTPTNWSVQLPEPQRVALPPTPTPSTPSPSQPSTGTVARLEEVQFVTDGIFVRTSGGTAVVDEVDRSRNRRTITIDLENTVLSPQLQREFNVDNYGVERMEVTQLRSSPPVARITLDVSRSSPDWRASISQFGGVVLLPARVAGNVDINPRPSQPTPTPTTPPPAQTQLAAVQSVELVGDQLLIRADRAITYTSGWDRTSNAYRITIPSARLADRVPDPQLGQRSPLQRVRLRQEDDRTVAVFVEPASGVQVGSISQPNQRLVSLQFQRLTQRPPTSTPNPPTTTPPAPTPTPDLPRVPNGRIVIAIDPGHGGRDPGAVGIGGLRETDVVLPVALQVASILERQGVQVVLTRRDEREIDLEPRVQTAERANADLFVSIHANAISMDRPEVNGLETYYYSDSGARLARYVHNSLLQATNMNDRGLRQARFYVIRNTSMPAILVELGFVTGAQDAPRLASSEWRSRMAVAIAQGLLQYIEQNF